MEQPPKYSLAGNSEHPPRILVRDRRTGRPLSTLTLRDSAGAYSLTINTAKDANKNEVEALATVINEMGVPTPVPAETKEPNMDDTAPPQTTPDERRPPGVVLAEIRSKLTSCGFAHEDIPASDLEIRLVVDNKTGEKRSLHRITNPLLDDTAYSDLAQSVHRALAAAIEKSKSDAIASARALIGQGAHAKAYDAVRGGVITTGASAELFDVLLMIDASSLSEDNAQHLRMWRVSAATELGEMSKVRADLNALLQIDSKKLPLGLTEQLELSLANASAQEGKRESALRRYRGLLESGKLEAGSRAWTYRGMSLVIGRDSEEGFELETLACDAFLQAGLIQEAAGSAVARAKARFRKAPSDGLKILDDASSWLTDDPIHRELRAHIAHTKASFLLQCGQPEAALIEARRAADFRQNLHGAETARISSLRLAAFAAEAAGNADEAKALRALGDAEAARHGDAELATREAIAQAVVERDWQGVQSLRDSAGPLDESLELSLKCLEAVRRPDLSVSERLALLDEVGLHVQSDLNRFEDVRDMRASCYAEIYRAADDLENALKWYREVLKFDPFDSVARQNTAAILAETRRWSELVVFSNEQVERHGRLPGILYCLGTALLRSGQPGAAAPILFEAGKINTNANMKAQLDGLFAEAMSGAGKAINVKPSEDSVAAVSRDELDAALQEFARLASGDRRMDFWRRDKDGKGHSWVERPESIAKGLLATFLSARFGRSAVLEEVGAGAGRIDLFLSLPGGLSVVVELKMCGGGYSKQYALDGLDQLAHYMDAKQTSLGYLVVFDGRLRDYGKGISTTTTLPKGIVRGFALDLRPEITER